MKTRLRDTATLTAATLCGVLAHPVDGKAEGELAVDHRLAAVVHLPARRGAFADYVQYARHVEARARAEMVTIHVATDKRARRADAKQVKLQMEGSKPPLIWADRSALFILLKNLVKNAINVSPIAQRVWPDGQAGGRGRASVRR
jgi:signal transduction histidine kinase